MVKLLEEILKSEDGAWKPFIKQVEDYITKAEKDD